MEIEYKEKVENFLRLLIDFPINWEEKNQWVEVLPYLSEKDFDELIELFNQSLIKIEKLEVEFESEKAKHQNRFSAQWKKFKETLRSKIIENISIKLKEKDKEMIKKIQTEIKSHTFTSNIEPLQTGETGSEQD